MTPLTKTDADETLRQRTRARLHESCEEIASLCRRYGVARLSVFGSLTRAHLFGASSDIDLLVEFLPGVTHGFSFFSLEQDLEDLLGRRTQLLTAGDLSAYFRGEVVDGAEEIYHADTR